MTPFEIGWRDAELGKPLGACPFHRASGEAIAWRAGWRALFGSIGCVGCGG